MPTPADSAPADSTPADENAAAGDKTPAAGKRRRRGQSRRDTEVLDTAARLFHRKGFEATSIQDIADAVGILKGSIYYYIASKEDALYEIIKRYHDSTEEYFQVLESSDEPDATKLRRFIETETAHTARHYIDSTLFFTEWRSLNPERQKLIIERRDRHDKFVRACLESGQKQGVFQRDLDPKYTSLAILGMANSVYRWFHPDGDSTPEEVGRRFADFAMSAVLADR